MSWRRAMERDAVAVAFPDWEWQDDDVVVLDVEYDDGYDPTYTSHDPSFLIEVGVHRAGAGGPLRWQLPDARHTAYHGFDAAQFWAALNQKGSES